LVHLGFVLTGIVNTVLGPILPALSARLQLSDAQAGNFFTAQFLGSIAGVTATSVLLHHRRFRFSLVLGYLLMGAGLSLLASPGWRLALLGPIIYGLGLGVVIPTSNLLVSSMNPERRAAALSGLNFCWGAGAVLVPLAVSIAQPRRILWESLVLFAAGLVPVAAVMVAVPAPAPLRHERPTASPWRNFGRWRLAAALAAMFFLYVGAESALGGWLATLVKRLVPGQSSGWLPALSIFWGGLVLGRGLAPFLLRRMRERTLALTGLTAATLAILVLIMGPGRPWLNTAAALAGLGLAPVFPVCIALLSHFGEMERRVGGPMFAFASLGGAVFPWLVGVVSTASGSLQTGLIVPLLAGLFLLVLHAADIPRREAARDRNTYHGDTEARRSTWS
jgi:fucose permease